MPEINPPAFAGLEWKAVDDWFEAEPTDDFRSIYDYASDRFFRIGIRMLNGLDGRRVVTFMPRFSKPNVQELVDGILVEVAALREQIAQRDREKEARRAEAAEAQERDLARWEAEHKEDERQRQVALRQRLKPAVEEARALLARFGDFVVRKKELAERIASFDDPVAEMQYADLYFIRDAIRETGRKSRAMYGGVPSLKAEPVDWPDRVVIEALLLLTSLDSDHAQLPNRKGWDTKHSSYGHWCCAMLETGNELDRATALAIGRKMVGHYAGRQLLPILSEEEA